MRSEEKIREDYERIKARAWTLARRIQKDSPTELGENSLAQLKHDIEDLQGLLREIPQIERVLEIPGKDRFRLSERGRVVECSSGAKEDE